MPIIVFSYYMYPCKNIHAASSVGKISSVPPYFRTSPVVRTGNELRFYLHTLRIILYVQLTIICSEGIDKLLGCELMFLHLMYIIALCETFIKDLFPALSGSNTTSTTHWPNIGLGEHPRRLGQHYREQERRRLINNDITQTKAEDKKI